MAQRDIYGGVMKFFRNGFQSWESKSRLSTPTTSNNTKARSGPTRRFFTLSRHEPDGAGRRLEKIAALARKHGLITTIDSTFATPINCRPAEWGIDLVLHSGTKFFGGHSDLSVAWKRDAGFDRAEHQTRTTLGGCMIHMRLFCCCVGSRHSPSGSGADASALRIAEFLSQHLTWRVYTIQC